jgi:hypothetical protein
VLASVAIAVGLWALATFVQIRLQAPVPAPPPRGGPGQESVEARIPAGGGGQLRSCQDSENRLKLVIDGARSCNVDDDCTLFDYGYPLDCMTSVAKSQIPLLREEYRLYDESCEHRVFYDCPSEPFVRLALCRDNRCIVELDRRDDLEDATLDRLNRRQPGQLP